MANDAADSRRYYAQPGCMTDARHHTSSFDGLPSTVADLCGIVQGLLLHIHWAPAYGFTPPAPRQNEVQLRSVAEMLDRALALDAEPITVTRPLERRLLGNCRHFSTLLCAFLRHQGVPARARCGFGAYFTPSSFEDHWVCEYWHPDQRWVLVDAQLDAPQRQILNLAFDPLDVPRDQFIVAGQAWNACRRAEIDANRFGIFDMRGLWFIRGNVVRDLASLNRIELLPWDAWGVMERKHLDPGNEAEMSLIDRCAAATEPADQDLAAIRILYAHPLLRVPRVIHSFRENGAELVELAELSG